MWEPFERGAVHQKDVEPAVAIDVDEGHAAARRLEEVAVALAAPVHGDAVETRLAGDVHERKRQSITLPRREAQASSEQERGDGRSESGAKVDVAVHRRTAPRRRRHHDVDRPGHASGCGTHTSVAVDDRDVGLLRAQHQRLQRRGVVSGDVRGFALDGGLQVGELLLFRGQVLRGARHVLLLLHHLAGAAGGGAEPPGVGGAEGLAAEQCAEDSCRRGHDRRSGRGRDLLLLLAELLFGLADTVLLRLQACRRTSCGWHRPWRRVRHEAPRTVVPGRPPRSRPASSACRSARAPAA